MWFNKFFIDESTSKFVSSSNLFESSKELLKLIENVPKTKDFGLSLYFKALEFKVSCQYIKSVLLYILCVDYTVKYNGVIKDNIPDLIATVCEQLSYIVKSMLTDHNHDEVKLTVNTIINCILELKKLIKTNCKAIEKNERFLKEALCYYHVANCYFFYKDVKSYTKYIDIAMQLIESRMPSSFEDTSVYVRLENKRKRFKSYKKYSPTSKELQ